MSHVVLVKPVTCNWHSAFHMHGDFARNECECLTWVLSEFDIEGLSNKQFLSKYVQKIISKGFLINYIGD